jgi:hypothetical protein
MCFVQCSAVENFNSSYQINIKACKACKGRGKSAVSHSLLQDIKTQTATHADAVRTWIWLLRFVPNVGSLMGSSTISLLLASTMLFSPLSTVPTSSATNSANSWKPAT